MQVVLQFRSYFTAFRELIRLYDKDGLKVWNRSHFTTTTSSGSSPKVHTFVK